MGMYDQIDFRAACPLCGALSDITGQFKWGLLSLAHKKIGDRIVWSDPENKMWPKAIYTDDAKEPSNKSLLVVGMMNSCPACPVQPKPHDMSQVFIEIRDDVIVDVYLSVGINKARALFSEIAEGGAFSVWDNTQRDKPGSLAVLAARLEPKLMEDYVSSLLDLSCRFRGDILGAIEIILAGIREHHERRIGVEFQRLMESFTV